MKQQPIGIFDSGIGGLIVVKELFRQLPWEGVRYFGDSKYCPYGERSAAEVRNLTLRAVRFLCSHPLKAMIIACNTACAVLSASWEALERELGIPLLGVIQPGAQAAVRATRSGCIGVIGTRRTIQSGAYEHALAALHSTLQIHTLACPPFASWVEEGLYMAPTIHRLVHEQLHPLLGYPLDTLVLGCTHYPLLQHPIQQSVGEQVTVISSASETAAELRRVLQQRQSLAAPCRPTHSFFTTGEPATFRRLAGTWLEQEIEVQAAPL